MKIRIILSILICRAARFAIRLLGRGGTNLPGRLALRVCPGLLGILAKDVACVVITGTNGKTTSSRMLEQCFVEAGLSYFSNKSGANLHSGIIAEFAMHSTLTGKPKCEYALIECDEAAFRQVGCFLDAKCVLVTNIFRDQLDRYGEITHTLNNIKAGLKDSPNAVVCLNADCSLSVSMADELEQKIIYYGVETPLYKERVSEISDAPYCVKCKGEYTYDYVTYGHLGGFRCEQCGYARPAADVAVLEVCESTPDYSRIRLRCPGGPEGAEEHQTTVNLPGGYNIYNAAGVMAAAGALDIGAETAIKALAEFECGFGRMEKITVGETDIRMILIKNPAGANQVLNFLSNTDGSCDFVVCLNDRLADGTDISWIWDVDFEKLLDMGDRLLTVYVSGVRADDMALRFKYAGIDAGKIKIVRDYGRLLEEMPNGGRNVYIMPTYTSMLDLRDKIRRVYGLGNFWE